MQQDICSFQQRGRQNAQYFPLLEAVLASAVKLYPNLHCPPRPATFFSRSNRDFIPPPTLVYADRGPRSNDAADGLQERLA